MSDARSTIIGIVNHLGPDVRVEVQANGTSVDVKRCRCFSLTDWHVKFKYSDDEQSPLVTITLQGSETMKATLPTPKLKLVPTPKTAFDIDVPASMQLVLGDAPSGVQAVGCGEGEEPPVE